MGVTVRRATRDDIAEMHRVRTSVRENRLVATRIAPDDYVREMELEGHGWVAESDGVIIGFAVGNATTGNVWALFVDPAYEKRGAGRKLHDVMVGWLFGRGLARLWLTTDSDTRAARFYESAGWRETDRTDGGEIRYELQRPSD